MTAPTELPREAVELVTLIAERHVDNPKYGITKVAKIIFQIDRLHYLEFGTTLSQLNFFKYENGPFTKDFYRIVGETDHLDIQEIGNQDRITTQRPPEAIFSPRALEIIEHVISQMWDKDANELSEESHGIAWELQETPRGPISIDTYAFCDPDKIPNDVLGLAEELIAAL